MKKTTTLFFDILVKEKSTVLSFLSIFIGIIIGAVCYNMSSLMLKNEIDGIFLMFNAGISDKSKAEIFTSIIINGFVYFILLFSSGGNLFGREASLFITTVKFSALGALISYFYETYSLVGLGYTLLVFIPGKLLFVLASLFATKTCFDTSGQMRKGLNSLPETKEYTKIYALKMLIVLCMFLISWFIDFLCIIVFTGLFEFN